MILPRRRGLTLIELVIALSVMMIIGAPVTISITHFMDNYASPYSEARIQRAARDTVDWIRELMSLAVAQKRDFYLLINTSKTPVSTINGRWRGNGSRDTFRWTSDKIGYRLNTSASLHTFTYSAKYQTMTPAIDLIIYAQTKDEGFRKTDMHIIISGAGSVRLSKDE